MQFYDHASNMARPAQASAVARARQSSIADGTAYRVEFTTQSGSDCYWDGCRYDALMLAWELHANRNPVKLFDPTGKPVDVANIRF